MRIATIAEKRSIGLSIMPPLMAQYPDLDTDGFVQAYTIAFRHLNASFRYPRGLSWADYPHVAEPRYRPIGVAEWLTPRFDGRIRMEDHTHGDGFDHRSPAWVAASPQFDDPEAEGLRRFREADLVVAAMDCDPSALLSLHRLLGHIFPEGIPKWRVRVPRLVALDESSLATSLRDAPFWEDVEGDGRLAYARTRRFFDYNFDVNSLAVLGRTYRAAGGEAPDAAISKFGLQLLYALRGRPPMGEGHIVQMMRDWKGKGANPRRERGWTEFGSAASRAPIIEQVKAAGLLEWEGKRLKVGGLGHRFLELLHPDCEDPNLPFRLDDWAKLPEVDARARATRYVKTFFGKQKRHLARNVRDIPPGLTRP